VLTAVKLMYTGTGLSALSAIIGLAQPSVGSVVGALHVAARRSSSYARTSVGSVMHRTPCIRECCVSDLLRCVYARGVDRAAVVDRGLITNG
jgi:hypothetical protein